MESGLGAKRKSALVAGGGIIGLTCAYRLLRKGIATTVISPGTEVEPASWGNAGHIAVEQVEPLASGKSLRKAARHFLTGGGAVSAPLRDIGVWAPFFLRVARASGESRFRAGTAALTACMQRALPAWRALLADMDRPQLLIEDGHFVVWESARTASHGRTYWSGANIGPASFRPATYPEVARLEAQIARKIAGAIRFEGSGQIADVGQLMASLKEAVVSAGGHFVSGRASELKVDRNGRASIATEDGEFIDADAIVIAAGFDSGRLLRGVGATLPIVAERGYHVQAPTKSWPAGLPPVVFEDRAMIVTRFLTSLRASSFVEFARPDRPPAEAKWRTLERHVAELGLPMDSAPARWMGARPTLPDYLPAIGRIRKAANVFYACGHQHLGLTLAAITAETVADLVTDRPPAIDVRPFDVERFSR